MGFLGVSDTIAIPNMRFENPNRSFTRTVSIGDSFSGRYVTALVFGFKNIGTDSQNNIITSATLTGTSSPITPTIEIDIPSADTNPTVTLYGKLFVFEDDGSLGSTADLNVVTDNVQFHMGAVISTSGAFTITNPLVRDVKTSGSFSGPLSLNTTGADEAFMFAINLDGGIATALDGFTLLSAFDFGTTDFAAFGRKQLTDETSVSVTFPAEMAASQALYGAYAVEYV